MATFKILSIDGGGIRGMIPATWLKRLDDELQSKSPSGTSPRRLLDNFDLLAGTSTGSIVAAGLAIGKSPAEILKFYTDEGSKIFPKSYVSNPLRPAYSENGLEAVLKSIFGDATLGQAQRRLLVATFNGTTRRLRVFDSSHRLDQVLLLRDVVRASCAAPTFFPAKELAIDGLPNTQTLLDGGVSANNPAALALAEAFAQGHSASNIVLVSFGTGVDDRSVTPEEGAKRGWAQWAQPIINVMFDGSSSANEMFIERMLPATSNFRFQKYGLQCDAALDRADKEHLGELQKEANIYWSSQTVEVTRLVNTLLQPAPPPVISLGGRWKSEYTWTQGSTLQTSDWPEVVVLDVTGPNVTGYTEISKYPFQLTARAVGADVIGETISRDKTIKLNSVFILRLKIDSEDTLIGYWVGTGEEVYRGEWKLSKL